MALGLPLAYADAWDVMTHRQMCAMVHSMARV
jgi:hypothetical protein